MRSGKRDCAPELIRGSRQGVRWGGRPRPAFEGLKKGPESAVLGGAEQVDDLFGDLIDAILAGAVPDQRPGHGADHGEA